MKTRGLTCSSGICLESLEGRQLLSVGTVVHGQYVRIDTNMGRMVFQLTPSVTPLTVANFLAYVNSGRYNKTIFHRSIPGFIVQGGGYAAGSLANHIPEFAPVPSEFAAAQAAAPGGKVNVRGTVAMALKSPVSQSVTDPNSGTSEWFVNLADNTSSLDSPIQQFTTFARVFEGMNVADSIASLPTTSSPTTNSAFTNLPYIATPTGTQPVTLAQAKAVDLLPVSIDSKTRRVLWLDSSGATGTVTLSKGNADLSFDGFNFKTRVEGSTVVVTGSNITLESVSTHNTDGTSALAFSSAGRETPVHVGDITADGALKSITAAHIIVVGDITTAGRVADISLNGSYRNTISIGGTSGAVNVAIETAVDTSVTTTSTLASLQSLNWKDDGIRPLSISGASIGRIFLNGNLNASITATTGNIGSVYASGEIGASGTPVWNVHGNVGSVHARNISHLTATINGNLGSLDTRVISQNSSITAATINSIACTYITTSSSITASNTIKSLSVSNIIDSSTIKAVNSIGSLSAASINSSSIYAGPASTLAKGLPSSATDFANLSASIKSARTSKFSNSTIAAPTLGTVSLGTVKVDNKGIAFGLAAHTVIKQLTARTSSGQAINLSNVKDKATVTNYFSQHKIKPKDFTVLFV